MNSINVFKTFDRFAPLHLAEPWDNVGVLVDLISPSCVPSILFTIDLTDKVIDEATKLKANVIYCYHPPIFTPIKHLRSTEWKHKLIYECIKRDIAVYSPHTALDAVKGGVNDWLISGFDYVEDVKPLKYVRTDSKSHALECSIPEHLNLLDVENLNGVSRLNTTPIHDIRNIDLPLKRLTLEVKNSALPELMSLLYKHKASSFVITKLEEPMILDYGPGRIGKLVTNMKSVIRDVKAHCQLEHLRVAYAKDANEYTDVKSIAVCAGSGGSVLKDCGADVYVTGEMSHHDLLHANQMGVNVVLCEHSNSERGYLTSLVKKLEPFFLCMDLHVSKEDHDPITIV